MLSAAILAAAAWHLAFRKGTDIPVAITAPVSATARVSWLPEKDVRIRVSSPADVETALGVAHGTGRPWLMALYRQAALGRLAEWFGPDLVPLDLHARQMGLAVSSEELGRLSAATRGRLDAYAAGVRAAQASLDWSLLPAAVQAGFVPEPWRPEHTTSVERLFAWLGSPVDPTSPAGVARDSLAAFLGLQGLDRSLSWATRSGNLYARLMMGDSGVPPVLAVHIEAAGRTVFEGATLPGLPYRLCGRSETAVWCKMPGGHAEIRTDSLPGEPQFFPVRVSDGSVVAGRREMHAEGLGLGSAGQVLAWSGFSRLTDAEAWLGLPSAGEFGLSPRGGMTSAGGGFLPLGEGIVEIGSVVISGQAPETELLGRRLDAIDDTLSIPVRLLEDRGSILADSTAAEVTRLLLSTLDSDTESYLRNWDGTFGPSSIAASLFDLSRRYGPASEDSLRLWFGPDAQLWRWERDPGLRLHYPAARAAGLPERFDSVEWLRGGHPTSPAWGPSRGFEPTTDYLPAAAWEAYLGRAGAPGRLSYRRPRVPYDDFLGRFRAAPVRPEITTLSGPAVAETEIRPRR